MEVTVNTILEYSNANNRKRIEKNYGSNNKEAKQKTNTNLHFAAI